MISPAATTQPCLCRCGAASRSASAILQSPRAVDFNPRSGRRRRVWCHMFVICAILLLAPWGCATSGLRGLDVSRPRPAWPPPPAPARIRYVGQLQSSADVKRPPGMFKVIGELIVGARPPQQMYGPRAVLCSHGGQRVWVSDPGGRRVHMFDLERRA